MRAVRGVLPGEPWPCGGCPGIPGSLAIHAAGIRPSRPGTASLAGPPAKPAGDPGRPTARAFHAPAGCSESGSGGATSWSSSWSRSRARPAAGHFRLFTSAIADQHLAAVRLSLDNDLGKHAFADVLFRRFSAAVHSSPAAASTAMSGSNTSRDRLRPQDRIRQQGRAGPPVPAPRGPPGRPVRPGNPCGPACRRGGAPGSAAGVPGSPRPASPPAAAPPRARPGRGQRADRRPHLLGGDAALAQLGGERPAGQAAAVVPGLNPGPGEGGVVDQPYLGEPVEDGLGDLVRHPAAAQGAGQLCPRARRRGQQPQADLPGRRLPGPARRCRRRPRSLPDTAGGAGQARVRWGARGTARRRIADHAPGPVARPRPAAAAGSASRRGPTPSFSLIFFSISLARSGLSRRKVRAFSLPCPSWSPS